VNVFVNNLLRGLGETRPAASTEKHKTKSQ
jgi:hypothetical protein